MEQELVASLTAANITVLQPSHIQKEDPPTDVPYLFVRLLRTSLISTMVLECILYSLHNASHVYNIIRTIIPTVGKVCKNYLPQCIRE